MFFPCLLFKVYYYYHYFVGKNTIQRVVKNVHEGSVFSICVLKEGSIITGGGKDGRIVQFDSNLQPTGFEAQVNMIFVSLFISNFVGIISVEIYIFLLPLNFK